MIKKEYAIYIRNLKKALNNGLVSKKIDRVNNLSPKDWLKTYVDMNTQLSTKQKQKMFQKKVLSS